MGPLWCGVTEGQASSSPARTPIRCLPRASSWEVGASWHLSGREACSSGPLGPGGGQNHNPKVKASSCSLQRRGSLHPHSPACPYHQASRRPRPKRGPLGWSAATPPAAEGPRLRTCEPARPPRVPRATTAAQADPSPGSCPRPAQGSTCAPDSRPHPGPPRAPDSRPRPYKGSPRALDPCPRPGVTPRCGPAPRIPAQESPHALNSRPHPVQGRPVLRTRAPAPAQGSLRAPDPRTRPAEGSPGIPAQWSPGAPDPRPRPRPGSPGASDPRPRPGVTLHPRRAPPTGGRPASPPRGHPTSRTRALPKGRPAPTSLRRPLPGPAGPAAAPRQRASRASGAWSPQRPLAAGGLSAPASADDPLPLGFPGSARRGAHTGPGLPKGRASLAATAGGGVGWGGGGGCPADPPAPNVEKPLLPAPTGSGLVPPHHHPR